MSEKCIKFDYRIYLLGVKMSVEPKSLKADRIGKISEVREARGVVKAKEVRIVMR